MESFNTQEFTTPQEAATYHQLTQMFQTHITTHRLSFADARYVGMVLLGDLWVPWAARRGMSPTLGQDCSVWLQRRVRARQHRGAAFVFCPCQEASAEEPWAGSPRDAAGRAALRHPAQSPRAAARHGLRKRWALPSASWRGPSEHPGTRRSLTLRPLTSSSRTVSAPP